jgi:hypothetical protein
MPNSGKNAKNIPVCRIVFFTGRVVSGNPK